MSDSREQSRVRFEAWYASDAYPMTRPIGWHTNGFRQNHNEYWVGEIQEEWLTWQAAERETARKCAEIAWTSQAGDGRKQFRSDTGRKCADAIKAAFPEAFRQPSPPSNI